MNIKYKLKQIVYDIFPKIKEEKLFPIPYPVNVAQILEGKLALITGGSGGIGGAIAESFINSGCKVIISGTDENKLKKRCEALGKSAKYIVIDLKNVNSFPEKVRECLCLFSDCDHIDILVNSAGLGVHNSFKNIKESEYDSIMDVNAKGTFFMSQAVSQHMIEHNIKGHILNISSSSALRPAWTPYEMSKWAIRGFTMGLADTLLPYGIIVNAIAPGPVATQMLGKTADSDIARPKQPSGRYAVPSEIAALATFMVSDLGDLIVGDTYYITGGSGVISLHH